MRLNADDLVEVLHHLGKDWQLLVPVGSYLINFADLAHCLKELVCRAGLLGLEEGEPEDLGVEVGEVFANVLHQVVINNVFEIHVVELVGPGVQHLEALVVHVLSAESLNVLLDEFEVSLVSLNGVAKVVLSDRLVVVAQEGADCPDA